MNKRIRVNGHLYEAVGEYDGITTGKVDKNILSDLSSIVPSGYELDSVYERGSKIYYRSMDINPEHILEVGLANTYPAGGLSLQFMTIIMVEGNETAAHFLHHTGEVTIEIDDEKSYKDIINQQVKESNKVVKTLVNVVKSNLGWVSGHGWKVLNDHTMKKFLSDYKKAIKSLDVIPR